MGNRKWLESRQLRLGVARYDLGTYGYDWGGRVRCEESSKAERSLSR